MISDLNTAQANQPLELMSWNALTESVADIESGVSTDTVARFTLITAHELARRLGGFEARFVLKTTAHLTGGTVAVPVPDGWEIAQVKRPRDVEVDGNLIVFTRVAHSQYGAVAQHGFVPMQGHYIPPGGAQTVSKFNHDPEHIGVDTLLKPVLSEQCEDGLPTEIYNNYHDVLLYGVLTRVFGSGGHIDLSQQRKFRAEYGYALRQIRVERSKSKTNKPGGLNTGGFLDKF